MLCKIDATLNNTFEKMFEWINFRIIAKRPQHPRKLISLKVQSNDITNDITTNK